MEAAHFGITPSTTPCIFYGHYHILECKHWVHTSTLTYCAENCHEPYPTNGPLERSRPFLCEACLSEQLDSWPDIARVKTKAEQVKVQLAIPLGNIHQLQEELHGLWQAYHFLKKMNFEHIKRHTGNRAYETLCDQFSLDDWLEYDFAQRDFENDVAAAAMASFEDSKDKKKIMEEERELGIPGLTEPPPSSRPRVPQPAWRDRSRSPGRASDDERSRRGRHRDRSPRRRMHDRDAVDPAANPRYRRRSISPLRADVVEIFGQLTVDPNSGTNDTVPKEVNGGKPDPKVDCECGKDIKERIILCHNKWCRKRFHYKSCAGLSRKPKGRWHCSECRGLKDICYCRGHKPASEPIMQCQSIECKSKSRIFHLSCVKGTVSRAQRLDQAVWSCPACWEDSCAKEEHQHLCVCKLCMAGALMVECENAKKSCDACDRYDDDCPRCQKGNSHRVAVNASNTTTIAPNAGALNAS